MRTKSMVLILVNLVMAAVLSVTPTSHRPVTGFRDCCQGEGPNAHCRYDCCWLTHDCDTDLDCQGSVPQ